MSGSFTPYAITEDILIKFYKEKEHISRIHEVCNELTTRVFGVQFANQWANTIQHLLPSLIYHLPAWTVNQPTVGEESAEVWEYPFGKAARLLRIMMRILLAYASVSCFAQNSATIHMLQRLHTAGFYLQCGFYDLTSRMTHSTFLSSNADVALQHSESQMTDIGTIFPIGVLLLLEQLIRLWRKLTNNNLKRYGKQCTRSALKACATKVYSQAHDAILGILPGASKTVSYAEATRTQENSPNIEYSTPPSATKRKCILCLESIREATSTGCGHLYCWDCIVEYCVQTKPPLVPFCPLCRKTIRPQHLARWTTVD